MDSRRRDCLTQPVRAAAWSIAILLLLAAATGCDSDGRPEGREPRAPAGSASREVSREYRVARTVKAFLVAFTDGDGQAACRLLTRQRQAELIERSRRPSCERAVALQIGAIRVRDLERLARAKVSKVALAGPAARAEVLTPAERGGVPESHTVRLRRVAGGGWRVASDFFPGALRGGKVPTPPPPPPSNPAQEREVAAVFDRFRRALERGDGKSACALRTPAAQRAAVSQAIQAAGGKRQALSDYGELTCAAVSAGLRVPDEVVHKVTVSSPTKARLTLDGGATYDFEKLHGNWKVDT